MHLGQENFRIQARTIYLRYLSVNLKYQSHGRSMLPHPHVEFCNQLGRHLRLVLANNSRPHESAVLLDYLVLEIHFPQRLVVHRIVVLHVLEAQVRLHPLHLLFRHGSPQEPSELLDDERYVALHLLVGDEGHVGLMSSLPETLYVYPIGAVAH